MSTRAAIAALGSLIEPGHHALGELVSAQGAVTALERVCAGKLGATVTRAVTERLNGADPLARGYSLLERADRLGARLVLPTDDEWPASLDELMHISTHASRMFPPLGLWVRGPGQLRDLSSRAVSIVGARAASPYGAHVARELGYGLAEQGWAVISGAAYGIDAAAHRGAVAADGATVAVLACGLDTIYPAGNAQLLEHIAESGLVISEWPTGSSPARHRFPVRNRVIAALAVGTVVVEAAQRSGSQITARHAVELGRPLMAVPGPVTSALSVGTNNLIRDWRAELVASASHVIEIVGELGEGLGSDEAMRENTADGGATPATCARDQLDSTARAVFDAFPLRGQASVCDLAVTANLTLRVARRVLADLTLAGFVEPIPESVDSFQLLVSR